MSMYDPRELNEVAAEEMEGDGIARHDDMLGLLGAIRKARKKIAAKKIAAKKAAPKRPVPSKRRPVPPKRPVLARPPVPPKKVPPARIIPITNDVFLERTKGGYFLCRKSLIMGKQRVRKIARLFTNAKKRVVTVFPTGPEVIEPATFAAIRTKLPAPENTFAVKVIPKKVASRAIVKSVGQPQSTVLQNVQAAATSAVSVVPPLPAGSSPMSAPPVSPFASPGEPSSSMAPDTFMPSSEDEAMEPQEALDEPVETEESIEEMMEEPEAEEEIAETEEEEGEESSDEETPSDEEVAGILGELGDSLDVMGQGPSLRPGFRKRRSGKRRVWNLLHQRQWQRPVSVTNGRIDINTSFDGADDADEVSSENLEALGKI